MADLVEIDIERKEELIMAKKLRACRVTILPKAPGKCLIPDVVPSKQKTKKESVEISMKQAAKKPPPAPPSSAAIAAASNPVALRYWNQCLANSSRVPLPVPTEETSPPSAKQDTNFPPWVTPETPGEVETKPNIVVPDMTRRVGRPLSHPAAVSTSTRRGSANSAVLEAVLLEEKGNVPRFPKPWQLHNQRQTTFAHQHQHQHQHHVKERKQTAMGSENLVNQAETRSCQLQQSKHQNQHKDTTGVDLTNPYWGPNKMTNPELPKKDQVENKIEGEARSPTGKNVVCGDGGVDGKEEGNPGPQIPKQLLGKNSEPLKERVFTSSDYEESERVERNDKKVSSQKGVASEVGVAALCH